MKNMNKHFSRAYNLLRNYLIWKRADYYIMSYPKVGRTWMRIFLSKYFSLTLDSEINDVFNSYSPQHPSVPRMHFSHFGIRGQVFERSPRITLDFTIAMLESNLKELRNKKVFFISRDPRDIVVSLYFYMGRKVGIKEISDMGLKEFIRHPDYGLPFAIEYHNTWMQYKDTFGKFEMVRYRDVRRDPITHFRKLLVFLELTEINEEALKEAVAYADFDNIQKLEKENAIKSRYFPKVNSEDNETFHARKGKVDGYLDYFDSEDIEYANIQIKKLDSRYGFR